MAEIEEGIKKVSGSKAMQMLFFKANLQIPANDVKGARQTVDALKKLPNLRPEIIDYFEARILLTEGKWYAASEAFSKLRPKMVDFGREMLSEVDYSLGLCYEHLGRPDLAKEQYESVSAARPAKRTGQDRRAARQSNVGRCFGSNKAAAIRCKK